MAKKYETWAIVGDMQVPFHDPAAIEIAAQIIEDAKPDHFVDDGDANDFWVISRHQNKRHEILQMISLQEEVDRTITVQDRLTRKVPKHCKKHKIDGNHEFRLETFLGNGPQAILGSMRSLRMEEVFRYKERGFSSYRPYGEGIWITPGLFVYHGEYVGALPGDSVKKEIAHLGCSVIMGHTHRKADLRFRQGKLEHRGIENGCLCQLSSGYKAMTNWSQAFTVVTVYDERHWNAEVVDIITDDKEGVKFAIFRGNKYEVKADLDDGLTLPWRPHRSIDFDK